jgi:hypothetical protein
MRDAIALTASLISFSGVLPYVRDVLRGKTHPNMVSWLTWCLLNLIIADGAAILTLFTITSYSIVSLAFPILVLTNCTVIVTIIITRRASAKVQLTT